MADLILKRDDKTNSDGSIPGMLIIKGTKFPTIERGENYVTVRKGTYSVKMGFKVKLRNEKKIKCLRFDHCGAKTILIHDALHDNWRNLEGCIAPGLNFNQNRGDKLIKKSKMAMTRIFILLR